MSVFIEGERAVNIPRYPRTVPEFYNLIQTYFAVNGSRSDIMQKIESHVSYRPELQEADTLAFMGRVFFMAAEVGYPYLDAHFERYEYHKIDKFIIEDPFDPRFFLHNAGLLGDLVLQKRGYISREIDRNRGRRRIMARVADHYGLVRDGQMDFDSEPIPFSRRAEGLPLVLPTDSHGFYYNLAAMPYGLHEMNTMSQAEFNARVMPFVKRAFSGRPTNPDRVLLRPELRWQKAA